MVNRHSELPKNTFDHLRRTRGKIAHGQISQALTAEIRECLPLIERLAAEAIAISLGADPKTLNYGGDLRVYDGVVYGESPFDPEQNPHTRWGWSILESLANLKRLNSEKTT